MFILRLHFGVVKTRGCFLRTLLFQKVEIEQQPRSGAHIGVKLHQFCVGVSSGDRSKRDSE